MEAASLFIFSFAVRQKLFHKLLDTFSHTISPSILFVLPNLLSRLNASRLISVKPFRCHFINYYTSKITANLQGI